MTLEIDSSTPTAQGVSAQGLEGRAEPTREAPALRPEQELALRALSTLRGELGQRADHPFLLGFASIAEADECVGDLMRAVHCGAALLHLAEAAPRETFLAVVHNGTVEHLLTPTGASQTSGVPQSVADFMRVVQEAFSRLRSELGGARFADPTTSDALDEVRRCYDEAMRSIVAAERELPREPEVPVRLPAPPEVPDASAAERAIRSAVDGGIFVAARLQALTSLLDPEEVACVIRAIPARPSGADSEVLRAAFLSLYERHEFEMIASLVHHNDLTAEVAPRYMRRVDLLELLLESDPPHRTARSIGNIIFPAKGVQHAPLKEGDLPRLALWAKSRFVRNEARASIYDDTLRGKAQIMKVFLLSPIAAVLRLRSAGKEKKNEGIPASGDVSSQGDG